MSTIAFIGGGNMSSCIFAGIVKSRPGQDKIIVSGPRLEKLQKFKEKGAAITSNNIEAAMQSEVIFLGVKPQMLTSVLQELVAGGVNFKDKLVVSMAAGFKLSSIERIIISRRIVRIMPNTPAKLGLGVTGIFFYEVSKEDKDLILQLHKPLGLCPVLQSEDEINLVGCVAGSAPAFLYRFLEALVAESCARGMSEEQARQIIGQMALGTASMVIANPDVKISALREAVTSKGGTTYEGLCQMTNHNFEQMMHDTVAATLDKTAKFESMF